MTPRAYILMSLPADQGPTVPCQGCENPVERDLYGDNVIPVCPPCAATIMAQALAGDGPIPAVHARRKAVDALHAFLSQSEAMH